MSNKIHRTALNFIDRYGKEEFKKLLESIGKGVSGQEIADRLNVSRERVRQWKNTFGESVFFYKVHPEVSYLIKENENEYRTTYRQTNNRTY